jgi:hypothetical protein
MISLSLSMPVAGVYSGARGGFAVFRQSDVGVKVRVQTLISKRSTSNSGSLRPSIDKLPDSPVGEPDTDSKIEKCHVSLILEESYATLFPHGWSVSLLLGAPLRFVR